MSISRTPIWQPKQDSLWQYTFSTPVDLVLLQIILKVIYECFPQHYLNISMCTNYLLLFVSRETRIIMINDQLLENSNLYNSQTKHCFQPKLSKNTYTIEF